MATLINITRQLFVVTTCFFWYMYSDTITCDGGTNFTDCRAKNVSCTNDELCTIHCKLDFPNASQYGVCVDSVINCKKHQQCLVRCDSGLAGCQHIIINAQNARKLDVISSNNDSFFQAKIYCPINGTCNFIANPLDTDRAFYGMNILSQAGFNSNANYAIDIECDKPNCLENVRINCTSDYSQSCLIDPLKPDRCINNDNDNDSCRMTLSPTLNPTIKPTTNISLQTESNHDTQDAIIFVAIIVIIVLCCSVSIYTINKCWQFEKTVDESDYNPKACASTTATGTSQPHVQAKTFNHIASAVSAVRTSIIEMQIKKELEMAHSQSQNSHNSPSSEKHEKNNKSHTETLTVTVTDDHDSRPGFIKMNTAQQELELNAIFEEMMQDVITEKIDDYDNDSSNSTKI